MLEEFLKIIEGGYVIEFKNVPSVGTCVTVIKNGHTERLTVNLDHTKEFGLPKDVTILAIIKKLIVELEKGYSRTLFADNQPVATAISEVE